MTASSGRLPAVAFCRLNELRTLTCRVPPCLHESRDYTSGGRKRFVTCSGLVNLVILSRGWVGVRGFCSTVSIGAMEDVRGRGGCRCWQVHLAVGEVMAAEKVREAVRLFAGGIVDLGSYRNQLGRVCCEEDFREGGAI